MYCPEGFLTLHEIFQDFEEYAYCNLDALGDFDEVVTENPPQIRTGFKIDAGPSRGERTAYAKWLMLALVELHRPHILVALPTGGVMRIAFWITEPFWSLLDYEGWDTEMKYTAFPNDKEGRLRFETLGFEHIRDYSFTVDRKKSQELHVQRLLKDIHGMPLCVRAELFPNDRSLAEFVEERLKARLTGQQSSRPKAAGHPLVPKVIELVERENLTREEARRRLGSRCLAAEWRAIWAEAGRLRPDLRMNIPGPKGPRKS